MKPASQVSSGAELARYKLVVRYDGTDFHGSQIQSRRRVDGADQQSRIRTVSGTLKSELEQVLRHPVHLLWAGRTDAGVHAAGNVCTFDGRLLQDPAGFIDRVNRRLPLDLWVGSISCVAADWHPRYAALSRKYCYRLWQGRVVPYDLRRFVWHHPGALDPLVVNGLLARLTGTRDFGGLAKAVGGRASSLCTMLAASAEADGEELRLHFEADRFLWRMVRNLAGLVMAIASARIEAPVDDDLLLAAGRGLKFKAAPASGLVLTEVKYSAASE